MDVNMISEIEDSSNWYIVEGQDLYSEDDFDVDLFQDRNYELYTFDIDYDYNAVATILIVKGKMW